MRYLTLLVTTVSLLVGGVPQNLSYQGFIKASDGTLLPDGSYTVTFRIYEEVTGGVSLWSEEHEIYLKSGMVSATLGESTSFTFSTKMNYLEIQVNGDVMTPRQKMTSVTYAFHAESAQKIATDSTTYTFPLEDGTSGQSLTTDGSGSLSWTTVDGGSSSATSLSATGDATGSGVLKLYEDTDDGTNYAGLKAGTMASDVTWTLPTADGTSGQVISTDGSGALSWSSVSGGSLTNATTSIGTGSATANLASDGDYDLVLKTGNSTTGSITITDGANGNITVTPNGTGQVDIGTDLTVTGNDITFGNGETISNATDGDFLFTTGTASGALTLKNSNGSDGIAAIELVSDAGAEVGDAYELQSLNGSFTITSDHTTKGTYDDTYLTIAGNATPASSTTTIAGDLTVSGDVNSSGAVYRNVTDKTSNYTVTSTDGLHVITNSNGASGNITITLPDPTDAANLGRELIFQPTNYGDIIITTHDGSNLIATVDGVQSTYTLIYFAYSVTLLCNGTYWTATGTSEDGSL